MLLELISPSVLIVVYEEFMCGFCGMQLLLGFLYLADEIFVLLCRALNICLCMVNSVVKVPLGTII